MCPNPEAANSPTGMGPDKPVDIILFCAKSSHVPENGSIVGKGKVPYPSMRCELGAGAVLAGLRRNGHQSQGHCQCPGSHLCLQCHRPHSERREREGCVSSPQHQGRVPGRSTALTWLMATPWVLDFAQVSGRLCCLSPTWGQSHAKTGLGLAEFGHCAWPHSTCSSFSSRGLGVDPCPQHIW